MPGPVAVCPGADVLQPYYQDEAVTLYHGDSDGTRGGVPLLGQISERFDAIVTDPPCNASVTSTRAGQSGQRLRRRDGTAAKIWRDFGDWDHDWPPGAFLEHVGNLLTDNGSLIAFTTEHLLGDYMLSGLNHRCLGYWRKTNPTPAFRKLYVRAVEFFVWQVKGTGGWTFNAGGYQPNVFDGPAVSGFHSYREGARVHQTQKPLWLMRALIELHTAPGDLILDPTPGRAQRW